MDPIVLAAGTAVVEMMAADAWQQTRAAVVGWWHRARPAQAETVGLELERSRARVLAARRTRDVAGEQALVVEWQARLHTLVTEDPMLVRELRRLLDEQLAPALASAEGPTGPVVMKARASGHGRVYQAGRDLQITER